jgi:hypothetical protein
MLSSALASLEPDHTVNSMRLSETLAFYLVIGFGVAAAAYMLDEQPTRLRRAFNLITAVLFWPLRVPILLAARSVRPKPSAQPSSADDPLTAAIAQVQQELDAALGRLDGWAEDVLAREKGRLGELRAALSVQAARIRDMDALLSATAEAAADPQPAAAAMTDEVRWLKSDQARQDNLARLCQVRRQAYVDLRATLAWIRELVSMIHLARFTGAPASRAEELVAQIAAAIEGVSAVAAEPVDECLPLSSPAAPAASAGLSLVAHPLLVEKDRLSCDSSSIPQI